LRFRWSAWLCMILLAPRVISTPDT
jgi:hypothetical protein